MDPTPHTEQATQYVTLQIKADVVKMPVLVITAKFVALTSAKTVGLKLQKMMLLLKPRSKIFATKPEA
jgi:hypothetical protein